MFRARLDARCDGLEIEQCAAARRASDVIRFETTTTRRLQDVVGKAKTLTGSGLAANQNRVSDAVGQE
jgi:hypothetical protein